MSLAASLLLVLSAQQSQPPQLPQLSAEVARLGSVWGECSGLRAMEVAAGAMAIEAAADAVASACLDHARAFERQLTAEIGRTLAADTMVVVRRLSRRRSIQVISEARGAPRERGPGTEFLSWGECVSGRAQALAAGTDSPDQILAAAHASCASEEQAARAFILPIAGEANIDAYMRNARNGIRDIILRRIAEARARR